MRNKRIRSLLNIVLVSVDLVLIYLSFILAYKVRFYSSIIPVLKGIPSFEAYRNVLPIIVAIWIIIYAHYGFYGKTYYRDMYDELIQIVKANVFGAIVIMALTFLYRDFSYSRLVLIYAGVIATVFVFFTHLLKKYLENKINEWNGEKYRVLLIGEGESARTIKSILKEKHNLELTEVREIPEEKAGAYLKRLGVDEIVIAKSPLDHSKVLKLVDLCEELKIKMRIIPDVLELTLGSVFVDEYYGLPVLQINPVSLSRWDFIFKRLSDIIISILVITYMLIPMLIIAVLIKLDSKGDILHKQPRMGFRGREFSFMKFRSMVKNANDLLEDLIHLNERKGPVFKMKDDPRITGIGKFLRRYSLDELPQLFNVLKGDMSIVGPRPQVLWEASHYDDWAKKRLRVLPGITGYWQISGRSALSYEDMIRLDIYYIENWSFELYFKIILKTLPAILSKKGAY